MERTNPKIFTAIKELINHIIRRDLFNKTADFFFKKIVKRQGIINIKMVI